MGWGWGEHIDGSHDGAFGKNKYICVENYVNQETRQLLNSGKEV